MSQIKIGDKVKVLPHERQRTIFSSGEVTPGKTYHKKGGWYGTVNRIFDDGYGGDILEVAVAGDLDNCHELSPDEVELA